MKDRAKPRCPYVDHPSDECYVARMDSGAVEKAIRFCRGIFERCEIYLKRKRAEETQSGDTNAMRKHKAK